MSIYNPPVANSYTTVQFGCNSNVKSLNYLCGSENSDGGSEKSSKNTNEEIKWIEHLRGRNGITAATAKKRTQIEWKGKKKRKIP